MSSITECGTEWWCPVVANEHYLRWGIMIATLVWTLWFEWIQFQRSWYLLLLAMPKLNGCEEFEVDCARVACVGLMALVGFAAQFCVKEGSWGLAIMMCVGWLLFTWISNPVAFFCRNPAGRIYRICCASVKGPFTVQKSGKGRLTERGFATLDEVVEFLGKPKSH